MEEEISKPTNKLTNKQLRKHREKEPASRQAYEEADANEVQYEGDLSDDDMEE